MQVRDSSGRCSELQKPAIAEHFTIKQIQKFGRNETQKVSLRPFYALSNLLVTNKKTDILRFEPREYNKNHIGKIINIYAE